MHSKIAILLIFSLGLWGCSSVDSAVGDFSDTIGQNLPKGPKDTYVEINPQTGLVQPTSEANQKQQKEVSAAIGKPLSLNLDNTEICDKQVQQKYLNQQFDKIPKRSLPKMYQVIKSGEKADGKPTLGRVSFVLDKNDKIIKAYCG